LREARVDAFGTFGTESVSGPRTKRHGWDGRGLADTAAVNDPSALNLTHVVLEGVRLSTGGVDMPEFGKGYSDAEVASLSNYVTGRFGGRAASITPDDVAKRRSGD
jgi:mono/diheme cytochrome c family protein